MKPAQLTDIPRAKYVHSVVDNGQAPNLTKTDPYHPWRTNGQVYIPRWVSHLGALGPNKSINDWQEYFTWAKQIGFNGVRVMAGELAWAGGQTDSSARSRLAEYLDIATQFGLAVEVTVNTGSGYDMYVHSLKVAEIIHGRKNVVAEMCNEPLHPAQNRDLDDLRGIGDAYYSPRNIIWAIGHPGVDETDEDGFFPGDGGPYNIAHLDRGRTDWVDEKQAREYWDNVRRVRELYGAGCLNNEPMGADEVDGHFTGKQRIADPTYFFAMGVGDRCFGVGGVHHSEAGRYAVLPGPIQNECASNYVWGHRMIDNIVGPEAVLGYYNTGHINSPVANIEAGEFAKITRCYSFYEWGKDVGVTVLYGLKEGQTLNIPFQDGWRGELVFDIPAQIGSRMQLWKITR